MQNHDSIRRINHVDERHADIRRRTSFAIAILHSIIHDHGGPTSTSATGFDTTRLELGATDKLHDRVRTAVYSRVMAEYFREIRTAADSISDANNRLMLRLEAVHAPGSSSSLYLTTRRPVP